MGCDDDDDDDDDLLFKKNHSLYITCQNFKNIMLFQREGKLVDQGSNLENGKNKFDSFFLLLPYFFFPSTFSVLITLIEKLLFPLTLLPTASNIFRL